MFCKCCNLINFMLKISIKNTKFVTQRLCQSRLLPIRPISILYSLLPGSRWTPFLPRESVVSALEKPPTNRHKIDQETIRIKIQIEMLQNQVTINIANCNTAVICINVIIKRVLWKDCPGQTRVIVWNQEKKSNENISIF